MMQPRTKRRPGIAIVMALVLMATLAVVFTAVTLQVVSQRRLLHERERQMQAVWLAQAGVEIAAGRLLESAVAFPEENYSMPDAKVHITTRKISDGLYSVLAAAELNTKEDPFPVAHDLQVHFRRTNKGGAVTLQVTADK